MRVRTFHVNFFLDKNELSHLEKICKESGLGKSEVIRNLIMGVEIKPRPTEKQLRLVREISGIANNINQMVDRDALLLIRGECPVMDRKYDLNRHPNIRYTEMGGAPPYKVPEDYCALSASIPAEDVQEEWKKGTPLAPELLSAFEVLHSKEELEEKKIERKKEQA